MDETGATHRPSAVRITVRAKKPDRFSESMTVQEVSAWLEGKNIPRKYCEAFEENYIDGKEFAELTEAEVKAMVPPIGLAKKIFRLVPKRFSYHITPAISPPPLTPIIYSPPSPRARSPSVCSQHSASSVTSSQCKSKAIEIPDHWCPETQACIDDKSLTDGARSDIVRTLVTLLTSQYGSKPTKDQIEDLAQKLILKYPWMKDDMGNGYDSWVGKIKERIRNVIKRGKKKAPTEGCEKPTPEKKRKLSSGKPEVLRRHPVKGGGRSLDIIDNETLDQHRKAIEAEMKKAKPRDSVLLPLMKLTFPHRRMYVQNTAITMNDILEKYSVLARPAVIEQEMALVLDKPDVKVSFIKEWKDVYVSAILLYGKKSGKKRVMSKLIGLDETDETMRQVTALAILTDSMCKPSKCVKDGEKEDYFYYLYETLTPGERIEDACKGPRTPRIVAFEGEERTQYFIICEQRVLYKLSTFQSALFIMLATYYAFNLEYPKQVKSVFYFFQDYVIGHPDSLKRPITYLAVVSDIRRNIVH